MNCVKKFLLNVIPGTKSLVETNGRVDREPEVTVAPLTRCGGACCLQFDHVLWSPAV